MFKPNLIIGLQKTKGSHSINCNIKEKKKRLFTCLNFIYVKGKEKTYLCYFNQLANLRQSCGEHCGGIHLHKQNLLFFHFTFIP